MGRDEGKGQMKKEYKGGKKRVGIHWNAFLHIPRCPRVSGCSGEGRKVQAGGKERDGVKGRGWCGFCLLPTFQSQS